MKKIKQIISIVILVCIIIFVYSKSVQATTLKVTTDTLNLRKESSTSSDIVTLLSKGDKCEVIEEAGNWYKVKYKTYTGYVAKEYVKVEETTNNTENKVSEENVTNNNTVVNEEKTQDKTQNNEEINKAGKVNQKTDATILPLVNSSKIATLNKDTQVTIITQLNGWSYIQTDSITAWIRSSKISSSTTTTTNTDKKDESNTSKEETPSSTTNTNNNKSFTEKTMYVNDSYVNLRKEASTSSEVVMVVAINTKLTVVGEERDWYKVKTSSGNAYVSKKLLSDKQTSTTSRGGTVVRGATENTSISESQNTEEKENTVKTTSVAMTESNTTKQEQIVSYAKKFLGVPYVYGGASKAGFDCSGFTMYVYKNFGISMRHGAQAQAKLGTAVKADKTSASSLKQNLKPGDLVFFLDYETMDEIGHCGIYIGDGDFIHASSGAGYCVKISSLLPGQAYNARYCAARRII